MSLNINIFKLVSNQLRKPVVGTLLIPFRYMCHNERTIKVNILSLHENKNWSLPGG